VSITDFLRRSPEQNRDIEGGILGICSAKYQAIQAIWPAPVAVQADFRKF